MKVKTKIKRKRTTPRTITQKAKPKPCVVNEPFEVAFGKKYVKNPRFNLEKNILKELTKAVSPSNITPQNDYYSYINERWMSADQLHEKQKYIVQVDDFRLVQDKVYRQLIEIVEEFTTNVKTRRAKEMKDFYDAMKRLNTDEEATQYAVNRLQEIDELRKNKGNLWKMLALSNSNEVISWGSPFFWSLNPDDKQPDVFRCFLDSPQLTLLDLELYFGDDGTGSASDKAYKKKYIARYMQYLEDLFTHAFGSNHGFEVNNVFLVEIKMLTAMGCDFIKGKKADSRYNKVSAKEALNVYKFDWEAFCKELGFEYTPEFFITGNLNYLKCGTELLLNEWDTEEWRTYWIYMFIRQQQRWNKIGRENIFQFLGKYARGQEGILDPVIAPIFSLGFAFNTFLSNEYIRQYQDEESILYVKNLADDLMTVFKRIINRNTWLQPQTKKKALDKLNHFNLEVGSPRVLREDPVINYSKTDAWGNIMKIAHWRLRKAIGLEGKAVVDIPVIDWAQVPPKFTGTQAYVVNASYTPSKNGIYIPLGYIQKPFVDLDERGIEYNLAHIGFTLGHEMSHALDDWGSQYDEYGKLNNWWTEKDRKKFKRIQDDVIKQYEVFASYDGIKFDASMSIGEDLADISGLTICREYLRDFQIKNSDILPIKSLSYEAFFIYFAYQMRQKVSDKAIQAQLKTNPHPLDKYRTNVPLSRSLLFRRLYNVKKGDKMWWHSTNRVWE